MNKPRKKLDAMPRPAGKRTVHHVNWHTVETDLRRARLLGETISDEKLIADLHLLVREVVKRLPQNHAATDPTRRAEQ